MSCARARPPCPGVATHSRKMSVMIDTSLGEVVVDLFCDEAPLAAKNFLKLCKMK